MLTLLEKMLIFNGLIFVILEALSENSKIATALTWIFAIFTAITSLLMIISVLFFE